MACTPQFTFALWRMADGGALPRAVAYLAHMNAHNSTAPSHPPAPVALPFAIVTVGEVGKVHATLDGAEFFPPGAKNSWTRAQFGELLDALTMGRTRTIRVEVRESDGTVFTDIIKAAQVSRQSMAPRQLQQGAPDSSRARRVDPPQLWEISGNGFIPGEDITVAIAVASAEGDTAGVAHAVIDRSQLMGHATQVLLVGHISGRIVTERLP